MSDDNFKSVDKIVFEIAGLLDSTLRNAARGVQLEELQVDYLNNWLNKEKDPLKKELLQTTLNYLKKETMNNNMEAHRVLQENGDGIKASMDFLKGMFPNMTLSLN